MIPAIKLAWLEYCNRCQFVFPFCMIINIWMLPFIPIVALARYWEFGSEGCTIVLRDFKKG